MAKGLIESTDKYTVEIHKNGRKTYGAFISFKDGKECYLALRSQRELFISGCKTTSIALREHKAFWCLDLSTLTKVRGRDIKYVGVIDRHNNDVYITTVERFLNPKTSKIHDYLTSGGSLQRRVNVEEFKVRRGEAKI